MWYNWGTSIASAEGVSSTCRTLGYSLTRSERLMRDHTPTKTCSKCHTEYPATAEYFRERKYSYGLRLYSQCRHCEKVYNDAYNKTPNRKQAEKTYQERHSERRVKSVQKWQREHPEEVKAAARARYKKNPEKYRKQSRSWAKAHPDSVNTLNRRWYSDNIDYARTRNKIRAQRRRTRQIDMADTLTYAEWDRALEYWHGCCAYCGSQQGFLKHQRICADHWIPITSSDCPGTIAENIVPACFSCNASKNDRNPIEWIQAKFSSRKGKVLIEAISLYFEWVKSQ